MVKKKAICCTDHKRVKGKKKWWPTTKTIWNKLHARWRRQGIEVDYTKYCDFCVQDYEIILKE